MDSALRRSESRRKGRKVREANGLELSIETAKKVSGRPAGMPRSCMKTRTSSYKLLRKRHNYGRRGSEPSALAHIGDER